MPALGLLHSIAHNVGRLNLLPSHSMAGVEAAPVKGLAALVALDMLNRRMGSVGTLSVNGFAAETVAGMPCVDKLAEAAPANKPAIRKLAERATVNMAAAECLIRKTVGDN